MTASSNGHQVLRLLFRPEQSSIGLDLAVSMHPDLLVLSKNAITYCGYLSGHAKAPWDLLGKFSQRQARNGPKRSTGRMG